MTNAQNKDDNAQEPTVQDLQSHFSELLRTWWERKGHNPQSTKEVLYGMELGLRDQGITANIKVHEDSNDYEE